MSDTVWCDGGMLTRDIQYAIDYRLGRVVFADSVRCDSITISLYRLPEWLVQTVGHAVERGQVSLKPRELAIQDAKQHGKSPGLLTFDLSGNKSFSMAVGQSGGSRFSQGLNVEFEATFTDSLRIRGSISDRLGSVGSTLRGLGGTTILSELDSYFFEISGRHVKATGGDIRTLPVANLPEKRMTGVGATYFSKQTTIGADIGRPLGEYQSISLRGVDGRQGPYQLTGRDSRPAGVVPGSERVYVDGRRLESGSDRHYVMDYASGRITFSPSILITSRSRIEIDYEASSSDYQRVTLDAIGDVQFGDSVVSLSFGFRRESDEKNRLRFGSLSETEQIILEQAGDSTSLAQRDGAVADSTGPYVQTTDSLGRPIYQFIGEGAGEYRVTFSNVGAGHGDYRYLGGDVYEFVGAGQGGYLPVVFIPLPSRTDFVSAALDIRPYDRGRFTLSYQASIRDPNLVSPLDDQDNHHSLVKASYHHLRGTWEVSLDSRFRQKGFLPNARLYTPDFFRTWSLPILLPQGDEFYGNTRTIFKLTKISIEGSGGFIRFADNIRAYQVGSKIEWRPEWGIEPSLTILKSESYDDATDRITGRYQNIRAGSGISLMTPLRLAYSFQRETRENYFDSIPDGERFHQHMVTFGIRRTTVVVSRRLEYNLGSTELRGPRLDQIEVVSEERFGRLAISIRGRYLEQHRLDSDRTDRSQRLFQTGLRYTPQSGWISIRAEYRQNDESARNLSFRYLEVGNGEGDYRFEDDQFLPDPDGDYIRVTEETGEFTDVLVAEKTHSVTLYPGRWPVVSKLKQAFSLVAFRVRTSVREEISGNDTRTMTWLAPWVSPSESDFLSRRVQESYQALVWPVANFYVLNYAFINQFNEQAPPGDLYRLNKSHTITFKAEPFEDLRMEVEWREKWTSESGLGFVPLELIERKYRTAAIITEGVLRWTPQAAYLSLTARSSIGRAEGVIIGNELVFRRKGTGEIRFTTEFSRITRKQPFDQPEYLITDGRRFGQSGLLDLRVNYDIGQKMRLSLNIKNRFFENAPSEFIGRGELVARF